MAAVFGTVTPAPSAHQRADGAHRTRVGRHRGADSAPRAPSRPHRGAGVVIPKRAAAAVTGGGRRAVGGVPSPRRRGAAGWWAGDASRGVWSGQPRFRPRSAAIRSAAATFSFTDRKLSGATEMLSTPASTSSRA